MSTMFSVLEVLCTAIGAFVLYCVVMVALWSGLVIAVRYRGRVGSRARRPTGQGRRTAALLPVTQREREDRRRARNAIGWDEAGSGDSAGTSVGPPGNHGQAAPYPWGSGAAAAAALHEARKRADRRRASGRD